MEDTDKTRESRAWGVIVDGLYPALIRLLTGLLILVLCVWMLAGSISILRSLPMVFEHGWAGAAEHAIIDALILLALLEVIRTLQAYLRLGQVRVTFISI